MNSYKRNGVGGTLFHIVKFQYCPKFLLSCTGSESSTLSNQTQRNLLTPEESLKNGNLAVSSSYKKANLSVFYHFRTRLSDL